MNNMPPLPPLQPAELRNDAAEIPVIQVQQQQPIAAGEGEAPPLFPQPPHVPSIGDLLAAAADGDLLAAINNRQGDPMMDELMGDNIDGGNAAAVNNNNDADDNLPAANNDADNDFLMELMRGVAYLENPIDLGKRVGFPDGSVAISKVDTSNQNHIRDTQLCLFGCGIKVSENDGSVKSFKYQGDLSVFNGIKYALDKNPALRGHLDLKHLLIDQSTIQRAIDIGFTGGDVAFIEKVTQRSGGMGIYHTMKAVHLTTGLWSNCLAEFCEKTSWLKGQVSYTLDQLRHPYILKQLIHAGELGLKFFDHDAFLADVGTNGTTITSRRVRKPYAHVRGENIVKFTMKVLDDLNIIKPALLRKVVKAQIDSRIGETRASYWRAWNESCDIYRFGQQPFNDFIGSETKTIRYYDTAKSLTNFMLETIRGDYKKAPFLPSLAYSIAQRIGAGDVITDNDITSRLCPVFLVVPTEDDGDAPSIVFTPNFDGELEDVDNDDEEEEVVVGTDYFLVAKANTLAEFHDGDFHPLFEGLEDEDGEEEEEEEDVYVLVSFVGVQRVNGEQVVVLGAGEMGEWYLRATNVEELSDAVENNLFAITSYGSPPVWYDEHPYLQVLRDRLAELEALSNEQQANASEPDVAAVSFETDQGVNASKSGVEEVEMDEQQAPDVAAVSYEEAVGESDEEVVDESEEEASFNSEEESSDEEEEPPLNRRRTRDRNSHMHNNAAQDEETGWD